MKELEICIIDDSHDMLKITRKVCERIMPLVPVKAFEDVDRAIDYLKGDPEKRRLLFVDLEMPHKGGWDFLESYTPSPDDLVFILSSSECPENLRKASTHEKVKAFIQKPLTMDRMREIEQLSYSFDQVLLRK